MTSARRSVVIHGYGTYAIAYRHMLELARSAAADIDWAIILPTSHHLDVLREVLPADRILCLEHEQRRSHPQPNLAELASYAGNIYADIEAEKQVYKHRLAGQQLARAAEAYTIYKRFLRERNATHLLLAHIETSEGKALVSLAKELGIPVIVPAGLRNVGGTAFTVNECEGLPDYGKPTAEHFDEARRFLAAFRNDPKPAFLPDEFAVSGEAPLPIYRKPVLQRLRGFVQRSLANPAMFEPVLFQISLMYAFPNILNMIRSIRGWRNSKSFDVASLDELPAKFIYYPLQTTPESSINTPAPYFIDQMRAIDAIRMAMPSDHAVVVKEHWASIGIRSPSFYRALRRKAGVRIAHFSLPSLELIRKAQVTISVTGTATLEAFLLGHPSLALGGCFMAEFLGGVCSVGELGERIARACNNPPDDETVVAALARIFSVRHEFVFRPADEPGYHGNKPENVRRLLQGLLAHLDLLDGARDIRMRQGPVLARALTDK
jgi:hypothetical protein